MKKEKMGDQGFSLVEIVIVMAIMVVLGSFAVIGLSVLSNRPVDECARKIKIALEGNRNTTMGKLSANISFYTDAEGNIMVKEIIDKNQTSKKIGPSEVTVSYINSDNTKKTLGTTELVMSFDRASGSLKSQSDGTYIQSFVVARGSHSLTVSIDRLTGRVEIN